MKRKSTRSLRDLGQKVEVENMNGWAAGPDSQLTVFICLPTETVRQIGILDNATATINKHDVAQFVSRALLANDFAGDLRFGGQVVPQKDRIGDLDEWIIHLEIKDALDVLPPQPA